MPPLRYTTSRPQSFRPGQTAQDPHARYRMFGPIQPMDEPGLLERFFRLFR